jgi:serine/threonine-protein kinase
MGEVYRARDTKLNRDVAVKVLPEIFAADPERLTRFAREAQTLAALNHPNIAQIYGVVETPLEGGSHKSGTNGLVMEFVDGEDLSAIIARGPLPLRDALLIARQIADALEAAHEQGIVHRDLKPANVKVKADGAVKVLDFGLAKAMGSAGLEGSPFNAMNSPTLTARATQMGVIVGTDAYMAPEQARGKAVDRRADVWAFGAVLFEMLTGRRAFAGDETSDVLAAVLRDDIDLSQLPATTPPPVRRMLARCLRKERRERLGDMSAVRLDIADTLSGSPADAPVSQSRPGRFRATTGGTILATAVATAAIVGGCAWALRPTETPVQPLVRATVEPPPGLGIATDDVAPAVAVSDTHVAFVAGPNRQLFVRALTQAVAVPVVGATTAEIPAFSPDRRWLAFFSDKDGRLKKVAVDGGLQSDICEVTVPNGLDWGPAGIVFSDRVTGIFTIGSDGGAPHLVVRPDRSSVLMGPAWLPDGHSILYTIASRIGTGDVQLETGKVLRLTLAPGAQPTPVVDGYEARFVPPRSLVFMRGTALLVQAFDPASGTASGGASAVLADVAATGYAVSPAGTLAFQPNTSITRVTYVWVDRQNHVEPTGIPPQSYTYPRISPDGSRVVIASRSDDRDLWT